MPEESGLDVVCDFEHQFASGAATGCGCVAHANFFASAVGGIVAEAAAPLNTSGGMAQNHVPYHAD